MSAPPDCEMEQPEVQGDTNAHFTDDRPTEDHPHSHGPMHLAEGSGVYAREGAGWEDPCDEDVQAEDDDAPVTGVYGSQLVVGSKALSKLSAKKRKRYLDHALGEHDACRPAGVQKPLADDPDLALRRFN